MSAERKPVDVLAVMKVDAIAAEEWRFKQAGDAFAFAARKTSNEARAAVAELIEEVEATLDLLETQGYAPMHAKLLRAALARCGAAP